MASQSPEGHCAKSEPSWGHKDEVIVISMTFLESGWDFQVITREAYSVANPSNPSLQTNQEVAHRHNNPDLLMRAVELRVGTSLAMC